jgi:hypothetical protein
MQVKKCIFMQIKGKSYELRLGRIAFGCLLRLVSALGGRCLCSRQLPTSATCPQGILQNDQIIRRIKLSGFVSNACLRNRLCPKSYLSSACFALSKQLNELKHVIFNKVYFL